MAKSNGELKIEKGIPIPPRKEKNGAIASLMRAMKVGDSIHLNSARGTVNHQAVIYLGSGNYTTRKDGNGFRIWRTK